MPDRPSNAGNKPGDTSGDSDESWEIEATVRPSGSAAPPPPVGKPSEKKPDASDKGSAKSPAVPKPAEVTGDDWENEATIPVPSGSRPLSSENQGPAKTAALPKAPEVTGDDWENEATIPVPTGSRPLSSENQGPAKSLVVPVVPKAAEVTGDDWENQATIPVPTGSRPLSSENQGPAKTAALPKAAEVTGGDLEDDPTVPTVPVPRDSRPMSGENRGPAKGPVMPEAPEGANDDLENDPTISPSPSSRPPSAGTSDPQNVPVKGAPPAPAVPAEKTPSKPTPQKPGTGASTAPVSPADETLSGPTLQKPGTGSSPAPAVPADETLTGPTLPQPGSGKPAPPEKKETSAPVRSGHTSSGPSAKPEETKTEDHATKSLIEDLTDYIVNSPIKVDKAQWRQGDKISNEPWVYELKTPLGKGGFGEVWLANKRARAGTGEDVALKLLEVGPGDQTFIVDEIQNNGKIDNFNHFIRFRGHFACKRDDSEFNNWHAIEMEYIKGASFSQLLKEVKARTERNERPRRPYFEPEEIQQYVKDLCEALYYLHTADDEKPALAHCDIKPPNLMLRQRGYKLKVADLGIARQSVTVSGLDPGQNPMSLKYGSPQQYGQLNPKPADDIYALGATLCHLLTGAPPQYDAKEISEHPDFKQPSLTKRRQDLWEKTKNYEAPKPVPDKWEQIILKCLSRERRDRPASARDILAHLDLQVTTKPRPTAPAEDRRTEPPDLTYAELEGVAAKGKKFNQYLLSEKLGGGGMGVVWKAEDSRTFEIFALKFLKPDIAQSTIKDELLSRHLHHRNIVRVENYVPGTGGLFAIPMEFVKGKSLKERLEEPKENGRRFFEVDEIKRWVTDLCEAISYAHTLRDEANAKKRGIIHRDIKPSNLMISESGDLLKVLDFGLARRVERTLTRDESDNQGLSIPFASPQQAQGLNPLVTDDIYSIGATIYTLLTGKEPPKNCKDLNEIKRQHDRGENAAEGDFKQPSIAERRHELYPAIRGQAIPAAWEEGVASCMAYEPRARPKTAIEILDRLGLREREVGDYKLVRQLRSRNSEWEEVWEAVGKNNQRKVVLTIYSTALYQQQDFIASLGQAVDRAKKLKHPKIAEIYEYGCDTSNPVEPVAFVAAEYCDGKTIGEASEGAATLKQKEEIERYISPLCDALKAAHKQGLTHQDIRPANLIIYNGSLKIINFGLADCIYVAKKEAAGLIQRTGGSKAVAKDKALNFMSPQRASWFLQQDPAGRPSDTPQDDMYAVGATIYRLLTGSPPFTDEQIIGQTPRLYKKAGALSPGLEYGVELCLKDKPKKRPTAEGLPNIKPRPPIWKDPKVIAAAAVVVALVVALFWPHRAGVKFDVYPADAAIMIQQKDASNVFINLTKATNRIFLPLRPGAYYASVAATNYTSQTYQFTVSNNITSVSPILDRVKVILVIDPQPPGFDYDLVTVGQSIEKTYTGKCPRNETVEAGVRYALTLKRNFWNPITNQLTVNEGSNRFQTNIPSGYVSLPIVSNGVHAVLYNQVVAESNLTLFPGPYTLTYQWSNWPPQTRLLDVKPDATNSIDPPDFTEGKVEIDCPYPDARVSSSTVKDGTTPYKEEIKPFEKRTYIVSASGHSSREIEITGGPKPNIPYVTNVSLPLLTDNAPQRLVPVAVKITLQPAGLEAEVLLDNQKPKSINPPDYTFEEFPRNYALQINASNYDKVSELILVPPGGTNKTYTLKRTQGSLTIDSQPPGLTFTLQGLGALTNETHKDITAPKTLDLPTGEYQITWYREPKSRWKAVTTNVTIAKVQNPIQFNPRFPSGTIVITKNIPDAEITIDQEKFGKGSNGLLKVELPQGSHNIEASYENLTDVTNSVTVVDGTTSDVPMNFYYGSVHFTVIDAKGAAIAGAEITLNGQKMPQRTPHTFYWPPGPLEVVCSKPNYRDYKTNFNVNPVGADRRAQGETLKLSLLHPPAFLAIASYPPGADIWTNGHLAGKTPLPLREVPATNYKIEWRLPNYQPWTNNIRVNDGGLYSYTKSLVPSIRPPVQFPPNWTTNDAIRTSGCGMQLRNVGDGLYAGIYEVTESEYKSVKPDASTLESRLPATKVGWYDADDFCKRLTKQDQATHRIGEEEHYALPTKSQYVGWLSNGNLVGQLEATNRSLVAVEESGEWNGFYGLLGNVAEWVRDDSPGNKKIILIISQRTGELFKESSGSPEAFLGFRCVLEKTQSTSQP
jgi:serine/threonine protein kinase